jgi:hypothetical protein
MLLVPSTSSIELVIFAGSWGRTSPASFLSRSVSAITRCSLTMFVSEAHNPGHSTYRRAAG